MQQHQSNDKRACSDNQENLGRMENRQHVNECGRQWLAYVVDVRRDSDQPPKQPENGRRNVRKLVNEIGQRLNEKRECTPDFGDHGVNY